MSVSVAHEYGPYTLYDLDALPEEGKRYELADGWLTELSPSPWHDHAADQLKDLLKEAARTAGADVYPDGVDTLASQLRGAGVRLISEPGQLNTPGGGYGFRFFDVDGRTLEVSAEVAARPHRRIEEQESIPVRLSHVVLNSPDLARTRDWYEQ